MRFKCVSPGEHVGDTHHNARPNKAAKLLLLDGLLVQSLLILQRAHNRQGQLSIRILVCYSSFSSTFSFSSAKSFSSFPSSSRSFRIPILSLPFLSTLDQTRLDQILVDDDMHAYGDLDRCDQLKEGLAQVCGIRGEGDYKGYQLDEELLLQYVVQDSLAHQQTHLNI
jgi:hypothetical protein